MKLIKYIADNIANFTIGLYIFQLFFIVCSVLLLIQDIKDQTFLNGLVELKTINEPEKYLKPDTLKIIQWTGQSGSGSDISSSAGVYGYLLSNPKDTRSVEFFETEKNEALLFPCRECKSDTGRYCECVPVLISDIHKESYINNLNELDDYKIGIYLGLLLETYFLWIIPFFYIYTKLATWLVDFLEKIIENYEKNNF